MILTGITAEIVKGLAELDKLNSETPEEFNTRVKQKTAEIFPDEFKTKLKAKTDSIIESFFNIPVIDTNTGETISTNAAEIIEKMQK